MVELVRCESTQSESHTVLELPDHSMLGEDKKGLPCRVLYEVTANTNWTFPTVESSLLKQQFFNDFYYAVG